MRTRALAIGRDETGLEHDSVSIGAGLFANKIDAYWRNKGGPKSIVPTRTLENHAQEGHEGKIRGDCWWLVVAAFLLDLSAAEADELFSAKGCRKIDQLRLEHADENNKLALLDHWTPDRADHHAATDQAPNRSDIALGAPTDESDRVLDLPHDRPGGLVPLAAQAAPDGDGDPPNDPPATPPDNQHNQPQDSDQPLPIKVETSGPVNVGDGNPTFSTSTSVQHNYGHQGRDWRAVVAVVAVGIVALIGALVVILTNDNSATQTERPEPASPTPTSVEPDEDGDAAETDETPAFEPAAEGEILIVIADFGEPVENKALPHREIANALDQQLRGLQISNVRWEYLSEEIERTDKAGRVGEIVEETGAAIVVWGERTAATLVTRVRVTDTIELPTATTIAQSRTNAAGGPGLGPPPASVTTLQLPDSEVEFISSGLPGEISFIALFLVSRIEFLTGSFDAAAAALEAGIAQVPEDTDGLAVAHLDLGIYRYLLNQYDAAIDALQKSIDLEPTSIEAQSNLGAAYIDNNQLDSAIAEYDLLLERRPDYAIGFANRGVAKFDNGDLDGALADLSTAIDLDPNYHHSFSVRGNVFVALDQPAEALEDFNAAIEVDPNEPVLYLNRGIAYLELNQFQRAVEDYSKALELSKTSSFQLSDEQRWFGVVKGFSPSIVYTNRGSAYGFLEEYERSIADYNEAIELNPRDELAFYGRGLAHRRLGQPEQALADYTEAISIAPDFAGAYANRGNVYESLAEYDAAIDDYDAAIDLEPEARTYFNRGTVKIRLGDFPGAISDFDQAIDGDQNYAAALTNRGIALVALGELDDAIADFDQAIGLIEAGTASTPVNLDDVQQLRAETIDLRDERG